jgi:CRISPR-associated exonuclease Cas4
VQGVADLVEFMDGVPYPIEYKRGKRRKWDNDEVQLCAQAICLEEMLQVPAPRGAIYHVKSRHRREIAFTHELRDQTYSAASRLHEVLRLRKSPPAILHPKCKQCSLHAICLPELLQAPAEYQNAAARLFELPRDEKG